MGKTKLKRIDEAWLGLDSVETDLFNPMSLLDVQQDDFNTHFAWLMTDQNTCLSFVITY